ncbi:MULTISPECIES: hypothetical protein [Chryseobacterium]|uniref:Uncharacterized protein n=1 Tax=Chryseobacterium camelliae TaxID=1265445 RepID=A0ABU0TGA1_9FLAO|nr:MULTISPECIES: hypothetical protein [Chryseobacterium]MDT3406109.1 hypothetical protein [Pseudacidovorax intermedius]MDQ1096089.1 hypothetical protein [Chryseobacterium camelliae]MDQ1100025.1 hypothetical protein [Chryseobacterium sp. SORGH_AS_1048]MDR6087369.1 hypothetical protein [Chryseobacterium sp. SORGH_AS_0909]MDR6131744.1 hypothetical protein [Chryseobacterium sp. SORGH_AS_1175]
MSFFKKIFSKNKSSNGDRQDMPKIQEIYTDDYFNDRYIEQQLSEDDLLVGGSFKMLESFFIDNKIKPLIEKPIYHPSNIDQAIEEGMGFYEYCKIFEQEDKQIGLTLTIAFSYF